MYHYLYSCRSRGYLFTFKLSESHIVRMLSCFVMAIKCDPIVFSGDKLHINENFLLCSILGILSEENIPSYLLLFTMERIRLSI